MISGLVYLSNLCSVHGLYHDGGWVCIFEVLALKWLDDKHNIMWSYNARHIHSIECSMSEMPQRSNRQPQTNPHNVEPE